MLTNPVTKYILLVTGELMQLTKHFSFEELTYTSRTEYLKENQEEAAKNMNKLKDLAVFAEQVRAIIGSPMIISSGYRCWALNAALKGSISSQHVKCEAIDFIPKNMTVEDAVGLILLSGLEYGQLIHEKTKNSEWVHISTGTKKEYLTYDGKIYMRGN